MLFLYIVLLFTVVLETLCRNIITQYPGFLPDLIRRPRNVMPYGTDDCPEYEEDIIEAQSFPDPWNKISCLGNYHPGCSILAGRIRQKSHYLAQELGSESESGLPSRRRRRSVDCPPPKPGKRPTPLIMGYRTDVSEQQNLGEIFRRIQQKQYFQSLGPIGRNRDIIDLMARGASR